MSIVHSFTTWVRRTFGWITSPQSWLEILVVAALVAAGFFLWWFRDVVPVLLQVVLWGALIVVTALLFRKGWLKLFGPVLFYDMVRSGRRGRYTLVRVLYAGLLFFLLLVVFNAHASRYYGTAGETTPQQAAQLAQNYFEVFMAAQLIAVFLLTPAYVAGAISDEKNRRTLEFLLATDLRSREIVLSKLGARMGQMAMFALTGLPILSFLQFLGGVSPNLIISGFVATIMTMFGLAGLSIFHSTYYKRPRNAIAITYLSVIAYVAISLLLFWLQMGVLRAPWMAGVTVAPSPANQTFFEWIGTTLIFILDQAIEAFNSGNLAIALPKVQWAAQMGTLNTELPKLVGAYAIFHGLVGGAGILWSIIRLRPVELKRASLPKRSSGRRRLFGQRHSVGSVPMLWKEMHVEGGLYFNWVGWVIVYLLVAASFVPLIVIFNELAQGRMGWYGNVWERLAEAINIWVRAMTVIVGCLMLLAIAVRASNSISSERDRQTWDSLMTTPMNSTQILAAKWLANIASVRFGWLWLGIVWLVGLLTGGMHPLAVPLVIGALVIFSAFASILGCWYSMVCKSSMRSTVFTLVTLALLAVGHWLPWMCCIPVFAMGGPGGDEIQMLSQIQGGLTPPFVMGFLPFYSGDFRHSYSVERFMIPMIICSIIGMGFWMFAATVLWVVAGARFRKITHREAEILPDFDRMPIRSPARAATDKPIAVIPLTGPPSSTSIQPEGAVMTDEVWETPRPPRVSDEDFEEHER